MRIFEAINKTSDFIRGQANIGVSDKPIEFYNQDMVRGGMLALKKLLKLLLEEER